MKNEYLTFENCLHRLEYSFLRVKDAYSAKQVDFQHPSLRDILLTTLQKKPQVKRQYILNASPSALSSIIEGVSLYNKTSEEESHVLILNNENELSLLLQRINAVITDTIPYQGLYRILISTDTLIPRKHNEKITPADLDLIKFSKTVQGRVVKTVLTAFGKQDTYDNNTQHLFFLWVYLLYKFYQMIPYIIPIPQLEYIDILTGCFKKANIGEIIDFLSLLSLYEPLRFKQLFNSKLEKRCKKYLENQLQENINKGVGGDWDIYEEYDVENEYEEWQYESKKLVELAVKFYSFCHLEPAKEIYELEALIDSAIPPDIPDFGDREDSEYAHFGGYEYWTFERIFEDL